MFDYPKQAEFNRIVPKTKIYGFAKPARAVRARFASQVAEVVWKYKLSPDTINLPARDGVHEIQIFTLALKTPELAPAVLYAIDRSVPSPIIFDLLFDGRVKSTAAYKRPVAEGAKPAVDEYFETEWRTAAAARPPLPVALDLAGLYEQILRTLLPVPPRAGELLAVHIERARLVRLKQTECRRLEMRIRQESQFNRQIEINAGLRQCRAELNQLLES